MTKACRSETDPQTNLARSCGARAFCRSATGAVSHCIRRIFKRVKMHYKLVVSIHKVLQRVIDKHASIIGT